MTTPSKGLTFVLVLTATIILSDTMRAAPGRWIWATRVASTVNDDDELTIGLSIDIAGNLYVTGWFDGTNDFGNGVLLTNRSGGGQDIFVAKYNYAGVAQWARSAGGTSPHRDGGRGIGVDSAGNVYVTGEFYGPASFGGINLSGTTEKEFFLARYDSLGTIQWVRQSVGGNGTIGAGWSDGVYGTGLRVNGAGTSYAVGFAANVTDDGTPIFFNGILLNNANVDGASAFIVKYDSEGTVQWVKSLNSDESSYSTSVATDDSGNVYVGGSFELSLRIDTTEFTNDGREDGYLARFNSAGTFQWARQVIGSTSLGLGTVATGPSGALYFAGTFGEDAGDTISFPPSITLTNLGDGDAFLARYDSTTGTPQWAVRAGGPGLDAYVGLTTDPLGNIYAGGARGGTGFPDNFQALFAKHTTNGVAQWTASSTGGDGAIVFGPVVIDANGNGHVAGWFRREVVFGETTLTGTGTWDFFLAKVSGDYLGLSIEWINSQPRLTIHGEPGSRFALDFASAVAAMNSYQPLTTNTLATSPMMLLDPSSVGHPTRFYRVRLVP